jgi:hypothetical protein
MSFEKQFVFKLFIFLIFLSESNGLIAQTTGTKAVKLNINFTKVFKEDEFHVGQLAPVFLLTDKKNNIHEIELNTFNVDAYQSSSLFSGATYYYDNKETSAGLRYQFDLNLVKKGKLIPFIGVSALTLFHSLNAKPQSATSYARKTQQLTELLSIIPQIRYSLWPRVFVDLAIPIDLFNVSLVTQQISNPNIPIRQQKNGWMETSFPIKENNIFHLRLGLGVKL